jgi:hypothetical protein
MASTYTALGVELMATGENAGTWGTKTNTNLNIIEQISGGYIAKSIAGGAQTTALSVSDGSTGAELAHRMIEFTGTISGNQIVTIPNDVQTFYFLRNSTSGSHTVQFKYATGSGDTFTFSATDKGDQLLFATANDGTNPDIYTLDFGDVTLTGTQTLTNKTLTDPILSPTATTAGKVEFLEGTNNGTNKATLIGPASTADVTVTLPAATDTLVGKATTDTLTNKTLTAPKFADAGFIADANGNEQVIFQTTASAVNEVEITNGATGNGPIIGSSGETNVDLNLTPKGLGRVTLGAGSIQNVVEKITVSATAATGTINYDVITQAVLYYTSNASGNFTVNFRGNGSNTLNAIMSTGQSLTVAFLVTNAGTAYYNNAVTIDGSSITPEWQGGSAPSEGNTNSIDAYTYTIIKTGDASFTALAAQTQYA